MSEWQPIETCPHWKLVLLWLPEGTFNAHAGGAWIGRRTGGDGPNYGYDERFTVVTPFSQFEDGLNKQVCVDLGFGKRPTLWHALPEPPVST